MYRRRSRAANDPAVNFDNPIYRTTTVSAKAPLQRPTPRTGAADVAEESRVPLSPASRYGPVDVAQIA